MNIEWKKNVVFSYNCTPWFLCFQLRLCLISPAAGEPMGPERHWFVLAACLDCTCLCFFEGVLGQSGGMKRSYFHTQLEHMVCMGRHESKWVGGFCGKCAG